MSAELFRALGALLSPPQPALQPAADALELGNLPLRSEHTELFTLQLVPYASVYLSNDGRIGGDTRDRIAGFWRALEVQVPKEPDHLSSLLALYAELSAADDGVEADGSEARRHHRRALLGEHLLPWLPLFLLKVRQLAPTFYVGWAELLESALEREVAELGAPAVDCVHSRQAIALPNTEDCELEDLVAALLSCMRSGLILCRADLAAAGRELGVATRIGERRFMLESMLRQRPGEVLAWLDRQLAVTQSAYREIGDRWPQCVARASRRVHAVRTIVASQLTAMG